MGIPVKGSLSSAPLLGEIIPFALNAGEEATASRAVDPAMKLPSVAHLLALCLEPTAACQLSAAIADPTAGQMATPVELAPGAWALVPIALPEAAPAPRPDLALSVSLTCPVDASVLLAVPGTPSAQAVDAQLPSLGTLLQEAGLYDFALATWQQYADAVKGTPAAARALLSQGDALKGMGRLSDAARQYQAALAAVDPAKADSRGAAAGSYSMNRFASDLAAMIRSRLVALVPADQLTEQDVAILEQVAAAWPPTSESREASLRLAECQIQSGRTTAQTVSYLLGIFDAGGERTAPHATRLADNQALIDRISRPVDKGVLVKALHLLNGLSSRHALGSPVPADEIAGIADAWSAAETAALQWDMEQASRRFQALPRKHEGTPVAPLATLAAGQWLHRCGLYDRPWGAETQYAAVVGGGGLMGVRGRLELAELHLARGERSAALEQLRPVATSDVDNRLRDWATYRIAQCEEFAGRWDSARALYAQVEQSQCMELSEETRMASIRLEGIAAEHAVAQAPRVHYLGADRSTQGDWYTYYGTEAFILGAQQAPQDIAGGRLQDWAVRPFCGNAAESVRYWVTGPADDHPSMLYNPLARVRRAANWDDRGEAHPRGTGPDLWVEVPVPAGAHRLSLYFVNDHNYYEPRRAYTVSVFDDSGDYQTGADVRDFVNGVYHQFAVSGPDTVRLCISRNLSMNVLLSGVFLDPLRDSIAGQAPTSAAWRDWASKHERHLSSADERKAFAAAVRSMSTGGDQSSIPVLSRLAASALSARQYGLAMWAADAKTRALSGRRDALRWHLQEIMSEFSAPVRVQAPMETQVVLARPFLQTVCGRYLDTGSEGLMGYRLAAFYRNAARAHEASNPQLACLAYERLRAAVGEAGLAPEDHYRMAFVAPDPVADTPRLERILAAYPGLPNRAALQMQLLGRYLNAGRTEDAECLVREMRAAEIDERTTANAVLKLGVHHLNAQRVDSARACFEEVAGRHGAGHWALVAQQYLGVAPFVE